MTVTRLVIAACAAGFVLAGTAAAETPTFAKDVAPILYKSCVSCHRPGEMGPMSLITYSDARPWTRSIRNKVLSREMPPWDADRSVSHFENDRSLSPEEIDTIVRWADNGAPQGSPADMPALPPLAEGWQIGTPDLVFELPVTVDVPATGTLPWKSFFVRTNFKEDMWVVAAEVRVEDRAHVHHAVVTLVTPGGNKPLGALRVRMLSQDDRQADGELTADERLKAQTVAARAAGVEYRLAGYAVGEQPPVFHPGLAKRIPAGSVLNFSMHYTTNGTPGRDRTKIGLVLAKEPPKGEIFMGLINNGIFQIPAGADNARVEAEGTFLKDVTIWALHPHMHVRGKDMTYTAIYADGRREVLLRVPRYRADWQLDYWFATPKTLPSGTRLLVTAHFDNSAANRNNPDPTAVVYFGDQTWDEMMAGYFTYTIESPSGKSTGRQ